ncbi:hypothetical protein [Mucilaginibacter humi]|nr:hypothetical protein [Mucilaginibacter humi]
MKNYRIYWVLLISFVIIAAPVKQVRAQFVIGEVIKLTVTKVIKAIDLKVQRMQNKTIWLQNAQK